jgi:hypothetical protein
MSELNLQDVPSIPDLSGIQDFNTSSSEPFEDGWYEGTIVAKREFQDKAGNDRVFETSDEPSQAGDSRNIKLQVEITRKSDGRKLGTNYLINYRPDDLSTETVAQVMAGLEAAKTGEKMGGTLFRSFMTLRRLGSLQKVAKIRQLARNGNGGLDLHPLFGKTGYFKLEKDDRNEKFKKIADVRDTAPKKGLL